jgi:hypothetical protein
LKARQELERMEAKVNNGKKKRRLTMKEEEEEEVKQGEK